MIPWGWAAAAAAVVSAAGAVYQGQQAAQQAKYQSAVLNQQAEREKQDAANREADYRRDASAQMARRRALMGAAGVEAGQGSPLLVSEDMAGEAELQALRIRSGGELQATRLSQQAGLARMQGQGAVTGSYFRAGASLLSGAGSAYTAYNKVPTGGSYDNPNYAPRF